MPLHVNTVIVNPIARPEPFSDTHNPTERATNFGVLAFHCFNELRLFSANSAFTGRVSRMKPEITDREPRHRRSELAVMANSVMKVREVSASELPHFRVFIRQREELPVIRFPRRQRVAVLV